MHAHRTRLTIRLLVSLGLTLVASNAMAENPCKMGPHAKLIVASPTVTATGEAQVKISYGTVRINCTTTLSQWELSRLVNKQVARYAERWDTEFLSAIERLEKVDAQTRELQAEIEALKKELNDIRGAGASHADRARKIEEWMAEAEKTLQDVQQLRKELNFTQANQRLRLTLEAAPSPPIIWLGVIAGGAVGTVSVIIGSLYYADALSKRDAARAECPGGNPCPSDSNSPTLSQQARSSANRATLFSVIAGVGFSAAAVSALYGSLVRGFDSGEPSKDTAVLRFHTTTNGAQLSWSGSF